MGPLALIVALTLAGAAAGALKDESVQSAALRRYPVLYLLHGLAGDYMDWTTRTNLAEYTRDLPLIAGFGRTFGGVTTHSPRSLVETLMA